MSTRGAIMTYDNSGNLYGVHHHQDSHPETLGAKIVDLYWNAFNQDYYEMKHRLIIWQQAGWGRIIEWDGKPENIQYTSASLTIENQPPTALAYPKSQKPALLNWDTIIYQNNPHQYAYVIEKSRLVILDCKSRLMMSEGFRSGAYALRVYDTFWWQWGESGNRGINNNLHLNRYYMPKSLYKESYKEFDVYTSLDD